MAEKNSPHKTYSRIEITNGRTNFRHERTDSAVPIGVRSADDHENPAAARHNPAGSRFTDQIQQPGNEASLGLRDGAGSN
jgi:hypothetical protein